METLTDRAGRISLPSGSTVPSAPVAALGQAGVAAGPAATPASVLVTVVGSVGSLTALADQLPAGWGARSAPSGTAVVTDLLVIGDATGGQIATAARLHPGVPVVGVVNAFAPAERVIEVLEAGADACVRSDQPAVVVSHLRACHRRRTLAA